jgi:hypothetical protein
MTLIEVLETFAGFKCPSLSMCAYKLSHSCTGNKLNKCSSVCSQVLDCVFKTSEHIPFLEDASDGPTKYRGSWD